MKIVNVVHLLSPTKCTDYLYLDGEWIVCKKCKRLIGFVYTKNSQQNSFIFPKFKHFTRKINRWVVNQPNCPNYLNNFTEQEWQELIQSIKQSKEKYNIPLERKACCLDKLPDDKEIDWDTKQPLDEN